CTASDTRSTPAPAARACRRGSSATSRSLPSRRGRPRRAAPPPPDAGRRRRRAGWRAAGPRRPRPDARSRRGPPRAPRVARLSSPASPALDEQLHGAVDRDVDRAGAAVDPAIAVELRLLARPQLREVAARVRLQARRGRLGRTVGARQRARRRADPLLVRGEALHEERNRHDGEDDEPDEANAPAEHGAGPDVPPLVTAGGQRLVRAHSSTGRVGSRSGRRGRPSSCRTKSQTQKPPRARTAARSSTWTVNRPGSKAGVMIQNTSTKRMTISMSATFAMLRARRFRRYDRRRMNGMTNWKKTMAMITHSQPPRMRSRYQVISSGRLPDQVIRNCDRLK